MNTKQLRQKILSLAIQGKLVPQDPNDEPAAVLLERVSANKKEKYTPITNDKSPFDVPHGWIFCNLDNVCEITSSKRIFKDEYVPFGVPFYRTKEIGELHRKEAIKTELFISEERYEEIRRDFDVPNENDILLSAVGTIGISWVVDNRRFYFKDGNLIWLKKLLVNANFIKYVLDWIFIDTEIRNGSAYSALTIEKLKKFIVPIPPLSEQQRIVAAIESAFAVIDEIERSKADLQSAVTTAKQKILSLAIQGKLVPQDPNDEPAAVLLERVCAEKERLIKEGIIKQSKKEKILQNCNDTTQSELLPNGWVLVKIQDICIINPRNIVDDSTFVSFVPMTLINDGFSNKYDFQERQWCEVKSGFTHFQEGDVGLAKITPCLENRKSVVFNGLLNAIGAGTTELHIFRPIKNSIVPEYLLWFFKSKNFISGCIGALSGAVGQQRVGKDYVACKMIPLPPLAEQKRIVAAIEATFEQLDEIT